MEGFLPLSSLRRTFQTRFQEVLAQRFFRDRLSMTILVAGLLANAATFGWLMVRLRPTETLVPVHFSSFTLFDELGAWYFPYQLSLLALLITVVNAVFAYHSFGRSRLASFFLLTTGLVVAIFSLIIAQAFGTIR